MGGLLCFYGETVAVNGTRYDVIKSIGEGGKTYEISVLRRKKLLRKNVLADAGIGRCSIKWLIKSFPKNVGNLLRWSHFLEDWL